MRAPSTIRPGDRVFLAMEFVEGDTLAAWLADAPRSWREIRNVFTAAGEGLAAAHEAGLVHRDFKPQNVMVARDGAVRVMDFGLASDSSVSDEGNAAPIDFGGIGPAPTSHTIALTGTGVLLGTPLYMAPEQFLAHRTDARTDQFSFCVALYEALYGERPFPSESFSMLLEAVVSGRIREPDQKTRAPSFLRKLLLRGLSKDPSSALSLDARATGGAPPRSDPATTNVGGRRGAGGGRPHRGGRDAAGRDAPPAAVRRGRRKARRHLGARRTW